jgi:hypothetical protein
MSKESLETYLLIFCGRGPLRSSQRRHGSDLEVAGTISTKANAPTGHSASTVERPAKAKAWVKGHGTHHCSAMEVSPWTTRRHTPRATSRPPLHPTSPPPSTKPPPRPTSPSLPSPQTPPPPPPPPRLKTKTTAPVPPTPPPCRNPRLPLQ